MNFEVIVTDSFERKFKRLFKKYKSLKADLKPLVESLAEIPEQGAPLGKDCAKFG
jgi:mRNA-degrading endonuclease RelE of RelBE toxin-antitoxin system